MIVVDRLLSVSYVVDQTGYPEIEFPLEHALVYFLSRKKTIPFEEYSFGMDYYPPYDEFDEGVSYPRSVRLTENLNYLLSCGLLKTNLDGVQRISLTEFGKRHIEDLLKQFNEKIENTPYSKLPSIIKGCLSNKRKLIEDCYRMYIEEL